MCVLGFPPLPCDTSFSALAPSVIVASALLAGKFKAPPARRNRTSFRTIFEYWPAWQAFGHSRPRRPPPPKICHAIIAWCLPGRYRPELHVSIAHHRGTLIGGWHIFLASGSRPVAAYPKIGTSLWSIVFSQSQVCPRDPSKFEFWLYASRRAFASLSVPVAKLTFGTRRDARIIY